MSERLRFWKLVGGVVAVTATLWLCTWLAVPLTAERASGHCLPSRGELRGVYHVHPVGHDGRDRWQRVLDAAQESCLDFVVVTNHAGAGSEIFSSSGTGGDGAGLRVLDGAEWTKGPHHHGQLAGAIGGVPGRDSGFRVLNHAQWSGAKALSDLTDEELALARAGLLGVEVLNATRLYRRPASVSAVLLALAAGPARPDLTFAALSEPGPDLSLWLALQREVRRALPLLCGSDAHGGWTDYRDLFPALVLHIPVPPAGVPTSADWVETQLSTGRAVCVNEYLGAPGPVSFAWADAAYHADLAAPSGCAAQVVASLGRGAEWRVLRDGVVVARGQATGTIELEGDGVYHLEVWREVGFGVLGQHMRLWAVGGSLVATGCAGVR